MDSGLALTAGLLQSPYFLDFDGLERNEPEGRGLRGISAFSRLYQASDGWFYLHTPSKEAEGNLFSLAEFQHLKEHSELTADETAAASGELASQLASALKRQTFAYWEGVLNPAGIQLARNIGIGDFRDSPAVRDAELIVTRDHPGQGMADHLGNTVRLSGTPMRVGRPTPVLGTDADEILAEAGFSSQRIATLKAGRVVVTP